MESLDPMHLNLHPLPENNSRSMAAALAWMLVPLLLVALAAVPLWIDGAWVDRINLLHAPGIRTGN